MSKVKNGDTVYRPSVRRRKKIKSHPNTTYGRMPEHMKLPLFQQIWAERYSFTSLAPEDGEILSCTQYNQLFHLNCHLINRLCKENVLRHDFYKLSLVMIAISQNPRKLPELVWQLGTFLLNTKQKVRSHTPVFEFLMKLLLHHQLKPEFHLNIAIRNIINTKQIDETYNKLTEYISSKRFPENHLYFIDFYGNIEYLLWKKDASMQEKILNTSAANQEWEEEDDDDEEGDDAVTTSCTFHRDRAMKFLKQSTDRISSTSLSALRYADMLHSIEGESSCHKFLGQYMKRNSNNPDAYRIYLLGELNKEERLKVLKEYSSVDPTSNMLKELIVAYMEKDKFVEALCLLVDRLSHKICSSSLFDWEHLYKLLSKNNKTINQFLRNLKRSNENWGKFLRYPVNNCCVEVKEYQHKTISLLDGLFNDGNTESEIVKKTLHSYEDFEYEQVSSPELVSKHKDESDGDIDETFFETPYFEKIIINKQKKSDNAKEKNKRDLNEWFFKKKSTGRKRKNLVENKSNGIKDTKRRKKNK